MFAPLYVYSLDHWLEVHPESVGTEDAALALLELQEVIRDADLTLLQKAICYLRYVGYEPDEISTKLKITKATYKAERTKAKTKLQKSLKACNQDGNIRCAAQAR